ncbi:MAG TPA: ATP-binding protein [Gemmatimonadales bacterium]|nr:ATP-binding protein [Gemmatimonadales bacterium]
MRHFAGEDGLPAPVLALAQDSTGFIWIGTRAGLFRYDGAEFRRWAPVQIPTEVGSLTVSPDGRVVAVDEAGRILEITATGARVIPGRAHRSPEWIDVAAFDREGHLWVMGDSTIAWRDRDGAWHTVASAALDDGQAQHILGAHDRDGVLVAAGPILWWVTAGAAPQRLLTAPHAIVDAETDGKDAVVALVGNGSLLRADSAGVHEMRDEGVPHARAISLAHRGTTFWIASDRYLTAIVPDGAPEVLGPRDGTTGGGPLLVDREGSLWLGGFTALSQYPEPDTRVWSDRDGLPSANTRFLARSGDVVWVTTWQGTGYLERRGGQWSAHAARPSLAHGAFCDAGSDALWLGSRSGFVRLTGSHMTPLLPGKPADIAGCVRASDGGMWIASSRGLLHATAAGTRVTDVPLPVTSSDKWVTVVLRDREGKLWAANGEHLCAATEARAVAMHPDWSCQALPAGTAALTGLLEMPSGTLWASSNEAGLLCYRAGRWLRAPSDSGLPTRSVLALVPARTRGVWLVGEDIVQRVAERSDGCSWNVLERLGYWEGLPEIGGGDLLEDEDGTIWIASASGVVRVPAHVRNAVPAPPRVAVVDARVDGQPVTLDGGALVLPHQRNRLELHFAALTFRDPSRVRYQVRLSERDQWVDTHGRPTFYWVDLQAGRYHAEVRASLDGKRWTSAPAVLAFRVLPPWYRTPWALSLFAVLALALIFALYRARLAYLLGLERQRTRIAMDLHDEMGSGLASIGILASVLATDGRDAAARTGVARQMADTAEELGSALSDIVWSLDPRSATLEELAAHLAERGSRLTADDMDFDTDFPAVWPVQPLPLALRRNLLLIGLEALHNAARHAAASRVVLALRGTGERWALTVRDDGMGLAAADAGTRGSGRGQRAMRQRAAEIGGRIAWEPTPGGGTTVRLEFTLPSPRAHLLARLDERFRRSVVRRGSHDHAGARADDGAHC